MSVVAWDGKTLAADKRFVEGSMIGTCTKVARVGRALVGFAGESAMGAQMLAWYRNGAQVDKFPEQQRKSEDTCSFMVVEADGTVLSYERSPFPVKVESKHAAIGSGRDFAMAAMHLGKTSKEAVEVACALDAFCGNGIDVLTHEDSL